MGKIGKNEWFHSNRSISWISQKGCLQFSLRIHHARASSLVFLQYLFGLAVVEAVKLLPGCSHIPVHLKWPNDIYIKKGDGTLKKIGGILVTSEYSGGTFGVTIGCGLNVLNPLPSTSISEYATDGTALEIELAFALILSKFQELYYELVDQDGSDDVFQVFRERYYNCWLHTYFCFSHFLSFAIGTKKFK